MASVGQGIAEFHLILGKAHLNREETEPAIAELERAVTLNPNLPFLHFNLGMAYERSGDYEGAESEFRRDIALEPDLADNYDQLGALYTRIGRDQDAERAFREALKRDSRMASAYAGLAKLYQKQQKLEPALRMADKALRRLPDYEGRHHFRGAVLRSKGQLGRMRRESRSGSAIARSAWCRGIRCPGNNFPARDETPGLRKPARAVRACPAFGAGFRREGDRDPRKPS